MSTWCTSCHGTSRASAGVTLSSVAAVRAHQFSVDEVAGTGTTMPPGGGPSSAERARLTEWLACGAP
jgi:uncharacterized membrane protein